MASLIVFKKNSRMTRPEGVSVEAEAVPRMVVGMAINPSATTRLFRSSSVRVA